MAKIEPKFHEVADEYTKLWSTVSLNAAQAQNIRNAAQKLKGLKDQFYTPVEAKTGVPWYVVGIIHSLECGFAPNKHLHNGDLLGAQTKRVPAGRPKAPPFDNWVHSAIDALTGKGLHKIDKWTVERIAYTLERYNGWGYRWFHPEVKTPYLWSFTNQYSRGKYVADGKFNPNTVSDQIGAMALLKQLVDEGLVVGQSGQVKPPEPPPPPVETGQFQVDATPFILRDAPDAAPKNDAPVVMRDLAIDKLEVIGDGTWWKIRVHFPDGSKDEGFAKRAWLRPVLQPVVIKEVEFAQACLDAARQFDTNAHFLMALADAESGIKNTPVPTGPFGPFAMTVEDWTAHNDRTLTGFGDADRFNPYAQPAVAARMAVKLTEEFQTTTVDKRLPTGEELHLARVLGVPALVLVMAAQGSQTVDSVLTGKIEAAQLSKLFELRPTLLTRTTTVDALRTEIRKRLDAGYVKAVAAILRVEPDLVLGPAASTDTEAVPWMAFARKELEKPVKEIPGAASNPEIEKYFEVTVIGHQKDGVAWCGAFVSWCLKQADKHANVLLSALAVAWLKNGDALQGPQFGAVAVLRPLVKGASGHVGFVVSWDETHVTLLGGNQGGAVSEQKFPLTDVRGWRMF